LVEQGKEEDLVVGKVEAMEHHGVQIAVLMLKQPTEGQQ
jgi:hypothetical protein